MAWLLLATAGVAVLRLTPFGLETARPLAAARARAPIAMADFEFEFAGDDNAKKPPAASPPRKQRARPMVWKTQRPGQPLPLPLTQEAANREADDELEAVVAAAAAVTEDDVAAQTAVAAAAAAAPAWPGRMGATDSAVISAPSSSVSTLGDRRKVTSDSPLEAVDVVFNGGKKPTRAALAKAAAVAAEAAIRAPSPAVAKRATMRAVAAATTTTAEPRAAAPAAVAPLATTAAPTQAAAAAPTAMPPTPIGATAVRSPTAAPPAATAATTVVDAPSGAAAPGFADVDSSSAAAAPTAEYTIPSFARPPPPRIAPLKLRKLKPSKIRKGDFIVHASYGIGRFDGVFEGLMRKGEK